MSRPIAWVPLLLTLACDRGAAPASAVDSAACDRFVEQVCGKAGPETARCTAVRDAAVLLHPRACGVALDEIGIAFDIRHATIEGGLAWPLNFRRAKPHVRAYFMKDFDWNGLRDVHVPLGTGRVDPEFFDQLRESGDDYPISVHVEYLEHGNAAENMAALGRDLATLRKLLNT